MKSYRKELWFDVPARLGWINITPQVRMCLEESGVREGLVLVNAMHITASVFVNDDEPGLHRDFAEFLERLAPHELRLGPLPVGDASGFRAGGGPGGPASGRGRPGSSKAWSNLPRIG